MNVVFFLDRVFMTEFFGVSCTCSSDYSVYEVVCTYTVARTFFCCTVCLRTSAHLHACAHTRMDQGHQNGVCRTCIIPLYLAFSLLMFHFFLLFLHAYFDITFLSTFLQLLVLKAQGTRSSARAA